MHKIIVGVDGSPSAAAALRWALDEGNHHGAVVVAVAAWSYLDQPRADGVAFDAAYSSDDVAEQLRANVAAVAIGDEVEQRVVCDLPVSALLEAAADADLLVVGARGTGGFEGLLLGSVSERILERATCPVAIVRHGDLPPVSRPVVVGYDGSEVSLEALHWAAAEAALRDVALHVVHAWQVPAMGLVADSGIYDAVRESGRVLLDDALADPALAGIEVVGHLESMGAAQGLMEHGRDAALIVSGTRGRGRLGRVLLGSTSRQLAHHASVPIVIVPLLHQG